MWNGDFSSLLEAPFSFLAKRTERQELATGENIWKCDLQGGRPSSQPPEAGFPLRLSERKESEHF